MAAAGLGDRAGGHMAPPAKPHPVALPRGTVQSSHVLPSHIHWEFPLVNLILQFCVFLSIPIDFAFFFLFFFPLSFFFLAKLIQ